mmetsp:Transcript_175398/g.562702  ORF Transcript_175398/g.562702 Transcript_175398/m.562702 type:complete len:232 (+) Transcript_175398:2482-3177(+)
MVLPSPVFISASRPWCRTKPPNNCTSKYHSSNTRQTPSRKMAKASLMMPSSITPFCLMRWRNPTTASFSCSFVSLSNLSSRSLIASTCSASAESSFSFSASKLSDDPGLGFSSTAMSLSAAKTTAEPRTPRLCFAAERRCRRFMAGATAAAAPSAAADAARVVAEKPLASVAGTCCADRGAKPFAWAYRGGGLGAETAKAVSADIALHARHARKGVRRPAGQALKGQATSA